MATGYLVRRVGMGENSLVNKHMDKLAPQCVRFLPPHMLLTAGIHSIKFLDNWPLLGHLDI